MFPGGCNVIILLVIFRLLMLQCNWMFTKRFTVSTPQRKCPMKACAPFTSILKSFLSGAVYEFATNVHFHLLQILLNLCMFTQLSLKWNWSINKYICGSLISLSWLNRTHFWNILSKLFPTLHLLEILFLFINLLISIFESTFKNERLVKSAIRQLVIHFKLIARETNLFIPYFQTIGTWNLSTNKTSCL